MLKIFLRHYPDFAKSNQLPLDSSEDDYELPVRKGALEGEEGADDNQEQEGQQGQPQKGPKPSTSRGGRGKNIKNPPPPKQTAGDSFGGINQTTTSLGKKTDLFTGDGTSSLKESDLKNEIDFPSLGGPPAPAKKPSAQSSWGRQAAPDMYIYENKNKALSKKEQEELFPKLGSDAFGAKKQVEKPAPKPVVEQKKPDFGGKETSGYNWMEDHQEKIRQMANDASGIIMTKAKKKKKRK